MCLPSPHLNKKQIQFLKRVHVRSDPELYVPLFEDSVKVVALGNMSNMRQRTAAEWRSFWSEHVIVQLLIGRQIDC
jgi:hypothetical protein